MSPFPIGDPRCPLTGEFSDVGRGRMSAAAWVVLVLSCAAGSGVALAAYALLLYARAKGL